jgi:hypothetical protein
MMFHSKYFILNSIAAMRAIVELETPTPVVQSGESTYFLSLDETVANLKKIPTSFVRKKIISIRENIDAPIIRPIHPPN